MFVLIICLLAVLLCLLFAVLFAITRVGGDSRDQGLPQALESVEKHNATELSVQNHSSLNPKTPVNPKHIVL